MTGQAGGRRSGGDFMVSVTGPFSCSMGLNVIFLLLAPPPSRWEERAHMLGYKGSSMTTIRARAENHRVLV